MLAYGESVRPSGRGPRCLCRYGNTPDLLFLSLVEYMHKYRRCCGGAARCAPPGPSLVVPRCTEARAESSLRSLPACCALRRCPPSTTRAPSSTLLPATAVGRATAVPVDAWRAGNPPAKPSRKSKSCGRENPTPNAENAAAWASWVVACQDSDGHSCISRVEPWSPRLQELCRCSGWLRGAAGLPRAC